MLMDVYPAFANKLFQNNVFMEKLVMSGMNPMAILDYPICGKCETLALFDGYGKKYGKYVERCTCVADGCGASTLSPVTLRDWIKDELKKKAPEEFMEALEYAVDIIASTMIEKYYTENAHILNAHSKKAQQKIGVVYDQYGEPIRKDNEPAPVVIHGMSKPKDKIDILL